MAHQHNEDIRSRQVVSVPVSLAKSTEGKYFVGQTEALKVGSGSVGWAGLINPSDSGINQYVNVFTVTNFSDEYLTAQIWLNTDFPEKSRISDKVSPTNTEIRPFPQNKAQIRFIEATNTLPKAGVNVYERIVPPHTTLVGEEDGKFIEAEEGNYVLVIKSQGITVSKVIVALGWWEKEE